VTIRSGSELHTSNPSVEDQQATIEDQQATIKRQRERVDTLESEGAPGDDTATPVTMNRRTALTTGGLFGLLLAEVGTASADPQGQLGTSQDTVSALYTEAVSGGVTGDTRVTDLVGDGLTVDSDTLTGTYVQDSEPPVGDTGTVWAQPASLGISDEITLGNTVNVTAVGDDGSRTKFLYTGDDNGTVSKIDTTDMSEDERITRSGTVRAITDSERGSSTLAWVVLHSKSRPVRRYS
jgi:hypothetical protein